MIKLISSLLALLSLNIYSDYLRVGKVEATYCKGFVIEYCSLKEVSGVVSGEDYFEIPQVFKNSPSQVSKVDDFHRCWFREGLPSFFFLDKEGQYVDLGRPDSVTFKCKKID